MHGFHNGANFLNLGAVDAIRGGILWTFSSRLILFESLDGGLTPNFPPFGGKHYFARAI